MLAGFARAVSAMAETLAISVPTVVEAARGKLSMESCDARLRSWASRILEQAGATVEVRGQSHLHPGETYVVMSNHRSLYDVPVLFDSFPGRLRMVAKSELFRIPIWGRAMQVAGFIDVDRRNSQRAIASLERAKLVLESGTSVWIAPEGTRSRSGELGPFKTGGFMLALGTGHKILPVALRGTERILPADGALVQRGAHVEVQFGEPVDPASYGRDARDALVARVRADIAALLTR